MFDSSKQGQIEKEKVRTILNTMVYSYDEKELESLLDGEDEEGEFLHVKIDRVCVLLKKNTIYQSENRLMKFSLRPTIALSQYFARFPFLFFSHYRMYKNSLLYNILIKIILFLPFYFINQLF